MLELEMLSCVLFQSATLAPAVSHPADQIRKFLEAETAWYVR